MVGYACINTILGKEGINFKSLQQKTFDKQGLNYVSELSSQNLDNLFTILKWNKEHHINFFRIGSDLFPKMFLYQLHELPKFETILLPKLQQIGKYILNNNMRVSFHPSHFNILSSENSNVVNKSIKELNQHSEIFDLMNLPQTHYYKINIHNNSVGKRTKQQSANDFCRNFDKLTNSCKTRLTVENDDKLSLFNTQELYDLIYKQINIPIVFDWLHDDIYSSKLTKHENLELVKTTWKTIKPVIHYSDSKKLYEDGFAKNVAHANLIHSTLPDIQHNFDIMVEAKMKEQAILKFL